MRKFICKLCAYIYDGAAGIPESDVPQGTEFSDLPDDWVCPLCGVDKDQFSLIEGDQGEAVAQIDSAQADYSPTLSEYTDMQLSAICSNLARAMELQYRPEESASFMILADYYRSRAKAMPESGFAALKAYVEDDLKERIPEANRVSRAAEDHGAMRALVWNEKVTKIVKSCLTRYETGGDEFIDKNNIYVCSACGFIFIGEQVPTLCPICKVPSWKFETVVE